MEKQAAAAASKSYSSSKKAMLKFLPRVEITSMVTFDHHHHHHHDSTSKLGVVYPAAGCAGRRGFSGPILSMIPPEARRKTRNGTNLESQEPSSPKVSCMGQLVKPKKKKGSRNKILARSSTTSPFKKKNEEEVAASSFCKRSASMKLSMMIRKMLPTGRKSRAGSAADETEAIASRSSRAPPPALCQMKRFSSGRDAFASFDWSSTDNICDPSQYRPRNPRNHYSDDEDVLERSSDGDEGEGERSDVDEDEDEGFRIPFSAPISGGVVTPLEKRKEINLWKRRTMAPPRPLQLKI